KLFDGTDILYPTQAENILRARIDQTPENDTLWTRLGNSLRNAGRPDLARPAYERAIALNPVNLDAHLMLAGLLEEKNAPRKAYEHWIGALRAARYAIDIPHSERLNAVSIALERALELAKDPNDVLKCILPAEPVPPATSESSAPCIVHVLNF